MLAAYIDETGDRGTAPTSSPIFGMAAVVVDGPAENLARQLLAKLRADFNTPPGRPLSWKADLKTHDRRMHAARKLELLKLFDARVIYVCCDKSRLRPGTFGQDQKLFYNYVAYYTLERILRTANSWPGGPQQVQVRFGAVRGFDHAITDSYFRVKKNSAAFDYYAPPWFRLDSCTWVQAHQYDMSQIADVYAGFMKAGLWPNEYGFTEGAYLRRIWPQINCSSTCAKGKGLKGMPHHEVFSDQEWWPCTC